MGKEGNGSELSSSDDKLFEPSLEMMVNDFDDESTLELEEKIASTEAQDPNAELNSLQKVSNEKRCVLGMLELRNVKKFYYFKYFNISFFLGHRKEICQSKNY